MAPYPDLPAKMPGVQLDRLHHPSSQTTSSSNNDPDWEQLADNSITNADFDHTDLLPTPPEVIEINDDDDDVPLPPPVKQALEYLPKIEHNSLLHPSPPPTHPYPT
jgi:hypothetical protein